MPYAECTDFRTVRWPWPMGYGGYLVRIAFDPLVTDNVAKLGDPLGWLELQRVLLQSVKNGY